MKNSLLRFTLAVVTTLIITPAFAHDPAEHAKTGEESPNHYTYCGMSMM